MTLELARIQAVCKPWGCADLRPWSNISGSADPIGELWFERTDAHATVPGLLLKLLFTSQPLSVQVHPDDAFARSIGLPNGKTETWVVLAAAPGARVALGLKRTLTAAQLRAAIVDGSIAQLVQWRAVAKGDVIDVPAGTIHAIGAGLVLAEIQQRSDATFRLFDYGRARELHADHAVAVAHARAADPQPAAKRIDDERTLLAVNPHFVLERVVLPPGATCALRAEHESWLLVLDGHAKVRAESAPRKAALDLHPGQALFQEADCATITIGDDVLTALVAYPGPEPMRVLLDHPGEPPVASQTATTAVPSSKPNSPEAAS
jgi:mannose-6-phosphate isomerase